MFLFHVFNSCFKLWFNSCFHLGFQYSLQQVYQKKGQGFDQEFLSRILRLILHTYFYQEFLSRIFIKNFTSLFYVLFYTLIFIKNFTAIFYILILRHVYEYEVSVKISVLDPDPNSIYLLLINRDFDQWMIFVI